MSRESEAASAVEMWEKVRGAHHAMMEAGDEMARLLRESNPSTISNGSMEPAAPAVGEDEALLEWTRQRKRFSAAPYELCEAGDALAARLRAALADVARLTRELATEKDYTQSAYLAAREAGEACGKAVDERNEARAAAEAAVAEEREALLDFIGKEKRQSASGSDYWNALDSVSVFVRARAWRNDGQHHPA